MIIFSGVKVSKVLESIVPSDEEELSVLQHLIYCAQLFQRSEKSDLSLAAVDVVTASSAPQPMGVEFDVKGFLSGLSEGSKKHFYSLVEALDIYQTIKGTSLSPAGLRFKDRVVYEIKQIRDMCLQDGPRAVY